MSNDADLAKLGIVIDATQVTPATTGLDKLTASGAKAETQAKALNTATAALSNTQKASAAITSDMLKATGLMNGSIEGTIAATKAVEAAQLSGAKTATETAALKVEAEKAAAAASVEGAAITVAAHEAVQGSSIKIRESLVLLRELSRGNFTRMAGSASILAGAFGLLTGSTIAFIAAAGAIVAPLAAVAVAINAGQSAQAKFNNELLLTGNRAGVTADSYKMFGKIIADTGNVSIATATGALDVLISSGKVSGDALQNLASASVLLAQRTGETAAKTAASFLGMSDGVTKFAVKFAQQYGGLITPAQIAYIAQLEEQGRKEQAEQALAKDVYDNLAKLGVQNLGYIQTAWNAVSKAASDYWEDLKNIGKDPTLQEQAAKLVEQISALEKAERAFGPNASILPGFAVTDKQLQDAKTQLDIINAQIDATNKKAKSDSDAAIAAQKADDEILKKQKAYAEAVKSSQAYIDQLKKEILQQNLGTIAAKEFAVQLEAAKAPTEAMRATINDLGTELVSALANKEINATLDDTIKRLDQIIARRTELEKASGQGALLSIATGQTQGSGNNPKAAPENSATKFVNSLIQNADQGRNSLAGDAFNSALQEDQATREKKAYDLIDQYRQADVKHEELAQKAKAQLDKQISDERLGYASDFFGGLATLSQSSNATLAAIGKAAAVTQTTIDTYRAATKALAEVPFPYNYVEAAAVTVAGLANVAKIAGLKDGGIVTGSGGPRDDSELRALSVGEFVVNANATANNRPLLEKINSGQTTGANDNTTTGKINVSIQNYGTSKQFEVQQLTESDVRIIARDEDNKNVPKIMQSETDNPNSKFRKTLSKNVDVKRRLSS